MRIIQIVTKPQRRGAEVFAYDLSQQFRAQGIEVKIIYLYRYAGDNGLPLNEDDVCLGGKEDHYLERVLGFHPLVLLQVTSQIRKFRPDIVQVNGSRTVKYGAAAKQLIPFRHWKLVYRNIGIASDWHRGGDSILAYRHMIMPKMDGVIGVSQVSLSDAKALYRIMGPAEVIINGVSPDRLQATKSRSDTRREYGSENDFVLLFLGYLERAKRPDRFLKVLARVSERCPAAKGWIVGDGPLGEEVRRMARVLGIDRRVVFIGNQPDVAKFLSAADLLLLTSDTEGVPATALEAAYLGLPVVATRVGGLPECITHGETGMLVDEEYVTTLSDAVLHLASDDAIRRSISNNAKSRARAEFTIDHVAKKYLDFYNRLSNSASGNGEKSNESSNHTSARTGTPS